MYRVYRAFTRVTDWISGNLASSAVALVYVAYLIKDDVREKSPAPTRCKATCTQPLTTIGIIARIADMPCPAVDLETYSLPITRDIGNHCCGPASMGAWMTQLGKFVVADDDGGQLAAFLWIYSRRRPTDPDESCSSRGDDPIGGESDHDHDATPLECKCTPCLMRLLLSMRYLDRIFSDSRYTPPTRIADITRYNESFTNAAFGLRLFSGIFREKNDPMPIFGENEQKESLDYLDRVLGYSRDILHCLQGMYIFQIRTGQFGCSPKRPSLGDLVTVIPGGEFLHIISQDKGRYVGATSVHGVMGDMLLGFFQELGDKIEQVTLH